jgi:hypothetical protein
MAGQTRHGTIFENETGTGVGTISLNQLPSMTLIYVAAIGGSAEVQLSVSDDVVNFFTVATLTQSALVQFAIPASVLAITIVSNTGSSITVTYRSVVLENIPSETLLIYGIDGTVTRPVVTPVETLVEGALLDQNKIVQTQIAAAATTLYTVPAYKKTLIENIFIITPP